ncbi:hypothetical protein UO65_3803 [Actinokineospora spheciospongiae]|uniref:ABC transporter ATP-binding protein n=1 Tax=Actinokineospora spheciospongiae TaxID=909613 RepID=W7IKL0_9PSEU|nr:hypothetical protein UO65_3803 [Actinokineospora spheciospongiae]
MGAITRPRPAKVLWGLVRQQRGTLLPAAGLSVLGAVAALAQPVVVNAIITAVQHGDPGAALAVGACALFLAVGVIMSVQQYLLQRMGEGVVLSARRSLVSALLRLPIAEFDRRRSGDLVSRVSSDTTVLRLALARGVLAGVGGTVTVIGALGALVYIDALLFGLTVLVALVFAAITAVLAKGVRRASQEVQAQVGVLTAAVDRAVRGIRTIRAGNSTDRQEELLQRHATASWHAGLRLARASSVIEPMSVLTTQAMLIIVLGVGGYRVAAGQLAMPDLVSFLMFVFLLVAPLGQIFAAVGTLGSSLGALDRIQEIRDLPSEDEVRRRAAVVPTAPADGGGARHALSFHDVRFGYDTGGGGDPALDGVSFDIERGARVALVGPSGAGKSTALNLVVGFYPPESGTITVGGVDAATLTAAQLRAGVAYVEQDAPALAGTLRENLTLTAPGATDVECWEALSAVNLTGLVQRSSRGLDSEVGESGVALSGGERQRLAIARALLSRPEVLLLDESTSNLDGHNEMLARQAVQRASAGCTLLVVAHRLSTVVDSDLILVFDGGRIVARGTHEGLLTRSGLYRELATHQLIA